MARTRAVVLDVETTGLGYAQHRVCEVALAVVEGTRVIHTWESIVNPERSIDPMATAVHGLTTRHLARAPTIAGLLGDILHHIEGALFVAHNAAFDHGFLQAEIRRVHGEAFGLPVESICTKNWAWRRFGRGHGSLPDVCERLGIINRSAHHALPDVEAEVQVLLHFLGKGGVTKANIERARAEGLVRPLGTGTRPTRLLARVEPMVRAHV